MSGDNDAYCLRLTGDVINAACMLPVACALERCAGLANTHSESPAASPYANKNTWTFKKLSLCVRFQRWFSHPTWLRLVNNFVKILMWISRKAL